MGSDGNKLKDEEIIDDQTCLLFRSTHCAAKQITLIVSRSGLNRIRHSDPYLIIIDPYGIDFQWNLGG